MPDYPEADLVDHAADLRRLEALELVSTSKLTLKQLEELVSLRDEYGSTYDRKLAIAHKQLLHLLEHSPRFEPLRTPVNTETIRAQLSQLESYQLPERVSLITPEMSREIRGLLANRLVTASALRRHTARQSGIYETLVELAEETWMGLSPADREWRMKGEMAQVLDPLRTLAKEHKTLAGEAELVYWAINRMLDTISAVMDDFDRSHYRAPSAEREMPKRNDDDLN